MGIRELRHNARVIDQAISMHCVLRDRYNRRALAADVAQLLASVVLIAFVFVDPSILSQAHMTPRMGQIAIGSASVMVFAMSIVALRVDWKRQAGDHDAAARTLSSLKSECRRLLYDLGNADQESIGQTCRECSRVMAEICEIPERDFLPLKAHHVRKVAASVLASRYPGAGARLILFILWWRAARRLIMGRRKRRSAS